VDVFASPLTAYPIIWNPISITTFEVLNLNISILDYASGSILNEYNVVYDHGSDFEVINDSVEPNIPNLVSAIFSETGTSVTFTFDSLTDKSGFTQCSQVFTGYTFGMYEFCMWYGSELHLYPGYGSSLVVGGNVTLLGNVLKSKCTKTSTVCDSWSYVPETNVTIQGPANPPLPQISLSGPSTLGMCDELSLYLYTSSGDGGRSYSSISYSIVSTDSPSDAATMGTYLTSVHPFVAASVVGKGAKYYITASVCNFLGGCGVSGQYVVSVANVSLPQVKILGSGTRSIQKENSLAISGAASVQSCANGGNTYDSLDYSWTLYVGDVEQIDITSTSRNPASYVLPANTLTSNTVYTLKLTALHISTGKAASDSLDIFVVAGALQALITGGSTQSVQQGGGVLTLDGSSSIDYNAGISSSLSTDMILFEWSCEQVNPAYSSTCGVVINSASMSNTTNLLISADTTFQNPSTVMYQSKITLTISDVSGATLQRTSEQVVIVTTTAGSAPLVSVTYVTVGKMNVNNKLFLLGTVEAGAGLSGNFVWSVDDASVDMGLSLTPSNATFASDAGTVIVSSYLVLPANNLPAGATLTFTLLSTLSSGLSSYAAVTVTTNDAPLPGSFTVVPAVGTSMNTSFAFSATSWTDDDTPLLYEFLYIDVGSDSELTIQSKSDNGFGSSTLPAGAESANYNITCVVIVSDMLDAYTSLQYDVNVQKVLLSSAELSTLVTDQLTAGVGSVDATRQVLVTAGSVLNSINCTAAPKCYSLNRAECASTSQTCGPCISTEYVGDDGDANTRCVLASGQVTISTRKLVETSTRCDTDTDCSLWYGCETNAIPRYCYQLSKECTGSASCANHGICSFFDVHTGLGVSDCKQGDISCVAECTCDSGYDGSDCSATSLELVDVQQIRSDLLDALYGLVQSENPSTASVRAWSGSLSSLTSNGDELSSASVATINRIATEIISAYTDATTSGLVTAADSIGLIDALDTSIVKEFSQLNAGTGSSRSRRLSTFNTTQLFETLNILSAYNYITAGELVPGQDGVTAIGSSIRVSSMVVSDPSSATYTVPLSFAEQQNNVIPTSMSISGAIATNATGGLNIIQLNAELLGDSAYHSDIVYVSSESLNCDSTNPCVVRITLQNNMPIAVDTNPSQTATESYSEVCTSGVFANTSHTCGTGQEVYTLCNGTIGGVVTAHCSVQYIAATCNMLSDSGNGSISVLTNGCTAVDYTSTNTTCTCDYIGGSSNYVSMQDDVVLDFASTWSIEGPMPTSYPTIGIDSIIDTNSDSNTNSIDIVMIGGILGGFVAFMLILKWIHYSLHNVHEYHEEAVEVENYKDVEDVILDHLDAEPEQDQYNYQEGRPLEGNMDVDIESRLVMIVEATEIYPHISREQRKIYENDCVVSETVIPSGSAEARRPTLPIVPSAPCEELSVAPPPAYIEDHELPIAHIPSTPSAPCQDLTVVPPPEYTEESL